MIKNKNLSFKICNFYILTGYKTKKLIWLRFFNRIGLQIKSTDSRILFSERIGKRKFLKIFNKKIGLLK